MPKNMKTPGGNKGSRKETLSKQKRSTGANGTATPPRSGTSTSTPPANGRVGPPTSGGAAAGAGTVAPTTTAPNG